MTHSYFFFTFSCLDYPIYVAFDGFVSVDYVRESESLRTVVNRVIGYDISDALIVKCSRKEFATGLIKIDFRIN